MPTKPNPIRDAALWVVEQIRANLGVKRSEEWIDEAAAKFGVPARSIFPMLVELDENAA